MVITRAMENIVEKLKDLATKDDIDNLKNYFAEMLEARDKKIEVLESQVSVLQNSVRLLTQKANCNEQYSRRTCLRIEGIPDKDSKKESDCIEKIKDIILKNNINISDNSIDRAHRNGYFYKDNQKKNAVIVKFKSFSDRTKFYRARKTVSNINIRLDLTKVNYNLLKKAKSIHNNKIDNNNLSDSGQSFVFADINCRLTIKLKNGKFQNFDSIEMFEQILLENADFI